MKKDAIIFDKDGTLIDFDAFWISVSENAISKFFAELGITGVSADEILSAFGVRDGIADIDGILCKGTYAQMGEMVYDILCKHGYDIPGDIVTENVISAYNESTRFGEVRPTSSELGETLKKLKVSGKKLAVVTTDNDVITHTCLEKLGIDHLFDRIYTDDGRTPTKPDPYCALDLSEKLGVSTDRMLMVGDTMTDVRFARNAGIDVIVLAKDEKSRAVLSPYADAVISNLDELVGILEL